MPIPELIDEIMERLPNNKPISETKSKKVGKRLKLTKS